MEIELKTWNINELCRLELKINKQPEYQRGEVWSDNKKKLLIDSLLRGVDIPKIYLREVENDAYEYEVADGQQRLSAIWSFKSNGLRLHKNEDKGLDLSKIGSEIVGGKLYSELSTVPLSLLAESQRASSIFISLAFFCRLMQCQNRLINLFLGCLR